MSIETFINIIVILLLVPTIIFALLLNKRLKVLRNSKADLSRLIEAFNDATSKAEAGIPRLKQAVDSAGGDLKEQIRRAQNLHDDLKYILERSVEDSYGKFQMIPYEYLCWESILLDVEPKEWKMKLEHKELSQKDIDDFCLSPYVQNWFFDEITKPEFNEFITKLSQEFKSNNFNVDLDKFIATNFDMIFTPEEIMNQVVKFNIAAYLRNSVGDKETAGIFYSLEDNYQFLTNIIRKSIYEYYVGKRYILNNQRQTASMFEKKLQPPKGEFELLQLDMIIACIEAKWVEHA